MKIKWRVFLVSYSTAYFIKKVKSYALCFQRLKIYVALELKMNLAVIMKHVQIAHSY